MKPFTAIDVCCGAGGWAVAARDFPIQIVAAFDMAEDCLSTYKLNHPATEIILGDVCKMDFLPWQGVDLILGGIPCETLSVARNNIARSEADMMAFQILLNRFLTLPAELSARWFCFEEVAQVIPLLPTGTPFMRLNSENFSAQSRDRVYIANFPGPILNSNHSILADHLRPGPHRISPRIFAKRIPSRSGKSSKTFQPFTPGRKAYTVTNFADSRRDAECATPHYLGWRNLTWEECASLQGFPPDYLFVGNPGRVSKMVAQAVQVDTARAILRSLMQSV